MPRVLLITGAGASLDFGAPSTTQLTRDLAASVAGDQACQHFGSDVVLNTIKNTLDEYLEGGANFEHMYHVAHEILYTQDPTPGAKNEFRPIMQPFLANKFAIDYQAANFLIKYLSSGIYKAISRSCEIDSSVLLPYSKFIEKISKNYTIKMYTTNYDDFAIRSAPELSTGFDPRVAGPQFLDPMRIIELDDEGTLFHLHGSIHLGFARRQGGDLGELAWFNDRQEALNHSEFSGGSRAERRMDGTDAKFSSVVTGLEKLSRLQRSPMSMYYAQFARDALRADVIVVAGSGLGDLHINTWLKVARSKPSPPPIILVDYWGGGFNAMDMIHSMDYKSIEMWHTLNMRYDDRTRGDRVGSGWTISNDRQSAIWDKGFLSFLNASDEFDEIVSTLNSPAA